MPPGVAGGTEYIAISAIFALFGRFFNDFTHIYEILYQNQFLNTF